VWVEGSSVPWLHAVGGRQGQVVVLPHPWFAHKGEGAMGVRGGGQRSPSRGATDVLSTLCPLDRARNEGWRDVDANEEMYEDHSLLGKSWDSPLYHRPVVESMSFLHLPFP